ncbi:MAG: hypothetical protein IH941_09195 [Acidobacteria bacterium]|nr:hypothetical protein [Acidobacteriota bacterium]
MVLDDLIRWFHLLAAMVWIGGMITVGALVPALRSAGVERKQLQAMARRFGVVSWTAMLVAVVTGVAEIFRLDIDLSPALAWKITLVGVAISIAFIHQQTARHVAPALRGAMEGASLLIGLAILAAAVAI